MTSVHERLLRCFQAVFPDAAEDLLGTATVDDMQSWDSTNHFMLLQVVEEEFVVRIPESEGGELLSFQQFEEYLNHNIQSS